MLTTYQIEIQIDDEFSAQVDASDLERVASATLHQCDVAAASLTIVITSNEEVQTLNRDFRGVDAPTDVLSFPNEADDAPAEVLPPELLAEQQSYLGDIIIALPYAAAQAERFGNSLAAELRLLTVHGVLHLLGYDHTTAEEEAEMWALTEEILSQFGDAALARRPHDDEAAA